MPCIQPNHQLLRFPYDYGDDRPTSVTPIESPPLFLSNSPEKIPSGDLGTKSLYRAEFPLTALPKRHRAFIWHTNDTDQLIDLRLLVSTDDGWLGLAGNVALQDFGTTGALYPHGLCLSKAQLYQSLGPVPGTVSFGPNEATLWSRLLIPGETAGCVLEFNGSGASGSKLRIRTVATHWMAVAPPWSAGVAPADEFHPRGHWDYSAIVAQCGTFDATVSAVRVTKDVVCCADGGPEEMAFPATPEGKVNEGLFGVDLNYQFSITHEPESAGLVHAAILAMMTGHPYFGAAEISLWEDRPDMGVPAIFWTNPDGSSRNINAALLTDSGPLLALSPFPQTLNIRVANAGAATMPFLLLLSNLSFDTAP